MKGIPGFTGQVSDLVPTANMYRMACKDREIGRPAVASLVFIQPFVRT